MGLFGGDGGGFVGILWFGLELESIELRLLGFWLDFLVGWVFWNLVLEGNNL